VLVGRDVKKLEETAADLEGACLVAPGDVASDTDVAAIFKRAHERFKTIDTVINCAGLMHSGLVGEIYPAEWWSDYVCSFTLDCTFPAILADYQYRK
jgi:NADP-dependent 3-hydroxy acid dehydrogenase YdfG